MNRLIQSSGPISEESNEQGVCKHCGAAVFLRRDHDLIGHTAPACASFHRLVLESDGFEAAVLANFQALPTPAAVNSKGGVS